MSESILQLYPRKPTAAPADLEALAGELRRIGLISTPFDFFGAVHYQPGPQFHRLIRFRRSHAVIPLEPGDGRLVEVNRLDSARNCRIGFSEVRPEAEFLGMGNTRNPLCPNCKRLIEAWTAAMEEWFFDKVSYRWRCPHCDRQSSPADWDWLKTAAIARFRIGIWGIHEGEAYPTERLLHLLATQLDSPWAYFYYRL